MARFYTAARRFPQLIGRTPDGTKLPFGPYTLVQLGVGAFAVVVLWITTWLWARFGLVVNVVAAVGVVFGAIWWAGRLPPGLRNPLVIVGGWMRAAERSSRSGRAVALVRLPKPRVAGGQVTMFTDVDPDVPDAADGAVELTAAAGLVDDVAAATEPAVVSSPSEPTLAPLSGVQLLLAQSTPR